MNNDLLDHGVIIGQDNDSITFFKVINNRGVRVGRVRVMTQEQDSLNLCQDFQLPINTFINISRIMDKHYT